MKKQLHQMPESILNFLNTKTDSELFDLGFKNRGKLCEYNGYENFNDRLWVWAKISEGKVYTLAMLDLGNCNNKLIYFDIYIPEIIYSAID